jgi:hypothetical protein
MDLVGKQKNKQKDREKDIDREPWRTKIKCRLSTISRRM